MPFSTQLCAVGFPFVGSPQLPGAARDASKIKARLPGVRDCMIRPGGTSRSTFMTEKTSIPNPPDQPEQQRRKTARELVLEKIASNPKWRDATERGRGFIIGGVRPPKESGN